MNDALLGHLRALAATNAGTPVTQDQFANWGYCWTHGFGKDPTHTSATCTRRAENHDTTATIHNMKGGNATIRRQRGDRQIYCNPNPRGQGRGNANNSSGNGTANTNSGTRQNSE